MNFDLLNKPHFFKEMSYLPELAPQFNELVVKTAIDIYVFFLQKP
jgi:hypothetical protein